MKTYGEILEISQDSLLVKANNEVFEISLNDSNRTFIEDGLKEETFLIFVDSTKQEIILENSESELNKIFPESQLEELEGATDILDEEFI